METCINSSQHKHTFIILCKFTATPHNHNTVVAPSQHKQHELAGVVNGYASASPSAKYKTSRALPKVPWAFGWDQRQRPARATQLRVHRNSERLMPGQSTTTRQHSPNLPSTPSQTACCRSNASQTITTLYVTVSGPPSSRAEWQHQPNKPTANPSAGLPHAVRLTMLSIVDKRPFASTRAPCTERVTTKALSPLPKGRSSVLRASVTRRRAGRCQGRRRHTLRAP